ncbi:MAG TPA: class I SAM-dependent methyltransferase [Pseudomonadales bacterium]|nr:class I SAM-dependent methyltransferase [Pseudomonadales bacterium]HND28307.1 class I SAM-dependent methyltransferase [Pseudomonadales bacterium]HNH20487.1 class I SAM-dependent methyltransferase [Pseudomonadales bacterium]
MPPPILPLLWMLASDRLTRNPMERVPEPTSEMDETENVEAFHAQGSESGPLLPIYHFNALATSCLLPPGGMMVDLGSGSAQYLAYLATARPDISIIGLELADSMIAVGRRMLDERGLADRVELRQADMRSFNTALPEKVDGISSVFALHHLPGRADLRQCIEQIATRQRTDNCAVWLFDHAPPRNPRTAERFPELFTPQAPPFFRQDSCNSLKAAFGFDVLTADLQSAGLSLQHSLAHWLPFYQTHWTLRPAGEITSASRHWRAPPLPQSAASDFTALLKLFPAVRGLLKKAADNRFI